MDFLASAEFPKKPKFIGIFLITIAVLGLHESVTII